MADLALGSVGKIIEIAVKIKEAVDTVKQNEKECRAIQRMAMIVEAQLKKLDEMTETMKDEANRIAMEDLAGSLEDALKLVTKCQEKHVVRRFLGSGAMAKELNRAWMDISTKLNMGIFVNTIQITIMLRTNQSVVPAPAPLLPPAPEMVVAAGFTHFSLSELEAATNNFSDENKIGCGGFSTVYKGTLEDGRVVAIKKLYSGLCDDNISIRDQITLLSKFGGHKNILRPLGYCYEVRERSVNVKGGFFLAQTRVYCLVEEYMPNGTMDIIFTHERGRIDLSSGFKMIQGTAHGLRHLHEHGVVHMDLKPSNILLDSDMNPRVADFGVAQAFDGDDKTRTRMYIVGTVGYMAPEYIKHGKMTFKSDMYAFGVVIIKTINSICASVPGHVRDFVEWAREEREAGRMELFDPRLRKCIVAGLLCTSIDPDERPTVEDLLQILNGEKDLPIPN